MKEDKDSFICDMAQYYHIYDWRSYPLSLILTLTYGLPKESRTMRILSNQKYTTEELLLATGVDALRLIWWSKTEDGQNNQNRPTLFLDILLGREEQEEFIVFDSVESYEKSREGM